LPRPQTAYEVKFTDYQHTQEEWEQRHAPDIAQRIRALNTSLRSNEVSSNVLRVITKSYELVAGGGPPSNLPL
jgi:hypothetical protein